MRSEGPSSVAANSFTPLTSSDPAAIAVIRVAGPAFERFARTHLQFGSESTLARLTPGSVRRVALRDADGDVIDDLVVSVRAPGPDWDVWLHLHGGPWIMRRCCELLRAAGFVQGPPDAASIFGAQSALDAAIAQRLPSMPTLSGVCWLLRQAEVLPSFIQRLAAAAIRHPRLVRRACARLADSIEVFDWYSRPVRIAFVGAPNAGKSTLFNHLVGDQTSIISDRPGTTRDWIEAPGELWGFPVQWVDTAGVFEATDPLDVAGVSATADASLAADIRVAVVDAATLPTLGGLDLKLSVMPGEPHVIVISKSDTATTAEPATHMLREPKNISIVVVSALNGCGIMDLRNELVRTLGRNHLRTESPALFTTQQAENARAAGSCSDHKTLIDMILRIIS